VTRSLRSLQFNQGSKAHTTLNFELANKSKTSTISFWHW